MLKDKNIQKCLYTPNEITGNMPCDDSGCCNGNYVILDEEKK